MGCSSRRIAAWLIGGAALAASGAAPHAEVPIDAWDLELWAGAYSPGPDNFDAAPSFGARVGYHWNRRWSLHGEVGIVELEADVSQPAASGRVQNRLTAFDFTGAYAFLGEKRTSFELFGGAGFASADLRGNISVGQIDVPLFGQGEDSFTVSGGGAIRSNINKRWYVRPAVRAKWFHERDGGEIDAEFMLGFGLALE